MIIAVSGNAGSGKDTTGDLLGKKLGLRVVKATLKSYAREKKLDILDFEEALKSDRYDRELDAWQREEVAKGDCVLVSMLSAYNAPKADLRVWLHAPLETRAGRIAKRDNVPIAKAIEYVSGRDRTFRARIKKIYGFDWWSQDLYDLAINTGRWQSEDVANIIINSLKK